MYLKKVHIQNIRSIADLTWQVDEDNAAGWHVILGDNGAGKTSILRSIALALVGQERAYALRQDWNLWLRDGESKGQVKLSLLRDEGRDWISADDEEKNSVSLVEDKVLKVHQEMLARVEDRIYEFPSVTINFKKENDQVVPGWWEPSGKYDPHSFIWSRNAGWFSASYGPFRRFSGGDEDYRDILRRDPILARHVTIFGERIALTETINWLQDLRYKQLEQKPEGDLLNLVKSFVNQDDFLPNGVCLNNVSSDDVEFVDGNGYRVPVEELSDGYRSILSMTFELIRQLAICYGPDKVFDPDDPTKIIVPGVVLIDEVDAHLHPTWQRRIGVWFRTHFPNIQFIVTTHSPLVCQAATHGTVFKLPTPGTDEQGRMITGIELNRLLYGNILDAYSTGAFGREVGRSEEGQQRLERLATLNIKELYEGLTEEEELEQDELRAALPTSAHTMHKETVA